MVRRCMLCFQAAKDAGVDQNDLEAWNVREKSDAELIALIINCKVAVLDVHFLYTCM